MITTSAAYKTALTQPRQHWGAKAVIDYTDYNLDNSIAATVNESDRLSDDAQLADGIERTTFKFFPSWNRFRFGQGYHLRDEVSTNNEKGALSRQLSDADGNFNQTFSGFFGFTMASSTTMSTATEFYPSFALTFSPRTVSSLRVAFDEQLGEWAEDFDVNIYKSGVLDTTETVTGNSSSLWTKNITPVLQATKVEVVVKSWNYPLSKAKVVESFTSIQETYTTDDIIEMSVNEESEPDDSTIPIGNVTANQCAISLINEILSNDKSRFENDNELSVLAGNVIKNRRIRLYSTLAGEEVMLGTFYSTKWKVKPYDLSAEAAGQDIISLMGDQDYTDNQFINPQTDVIDETYTTTAEFQSFTLDNAVAEDDELKMAGSAVTCDGINGLFFGFTMASTTTMSEGTLYCGEAERTISFTYTPGSSVRLNVTATESKPTGTNIKYFVSWKTVDEFHEITDDFTFTPEDISETSQTIKVKIILYSQSTDVTPVVEDVNFKGDEFVTLYSLAAKVIQDFDDVTNLVEGNYTIDQEFGDIVIPNAYLRPQSFRSALTLITQAAAGRAYVGRNGAIKVESIKSVGTSVKSYSESDFFDLELPVNPQSLYNRVTVVTKPLLKATSAEEIASVSIEPGTDQDLIVEYDKQPSEFDSFESVAGITVNSSTPYTWGIEFNVDNTNGSATTVGINGFPYRVTGSKRISLDDTESTRKNGVIEYKIDDNPLIQTEEQANTITSLLIDSYATNRRQFTADVTPDPSLEVGDTVTIRSQGYIINSEEIEFAGGQMTHVIGGKA